MLPRPTNHTGPYILIHTDGSCLGNPGPGGYAAVLRRIEANGSAGARRAITGREIDTTNNRMELLAAIQGLKALKRSVLPVVVVTDSQYVCRGITRWIGQWKERGWKTAAGKDVANAILWADLDRIARTQRCEWVWSRGHAGDALNEEADRLAREEARTAAV